MVQISPVDCVGCGEHGPGPQLGATSAHLFKDARLDAGVARAQQASSAAHHMRMLICEYIASP